MTKFKDFLKEINFTIHHKGLFSLNKINESNIIKTFQSDVLGKCTVVKDNDKTTLYDEQGYIHSEIHDDFTRVQGPFALLPIGSLMMKPKEVLLIGLGLGNVYNFFTHFLPDANVTSIEYDANTAKTTQEFLGIPKASVIVADGSRAVYELPTAIYDVLILDAYDNVTIPEGFRTQEFWDQAKVICKKECCITVNYCAGSSEDFEVFSAVHNLIQETFDIKYISKAKADGFDNFVYHYFAFEPQTDLSAYVQGEYNPVALDNSEGYGFTDEI